MNDKKFDVGAEEGNFFMDLFRGGGDELLQRIHDADERKLDQTDDLTEEGPPKAA